MNNKQNFLDQINLLSIPKEHGGFNVKDDLDGLY
jgi:hypothetical protein